MSAFNPEKLHVRFDEGMQAPGDIYPRCYTLTHSDQSGDLYLSIGQAFDQKQISGWYTRLMRDEVVGEWQPGDPPSLHLHLHVSGGLILGSARWRDAIFRSHLPLVLDAICYGDQAFLQENPTLKHAPVLIHFHAKQGDLNCVEQRGIVNDYLPHIH